MSGKVDRLERRLDRASEAGKPWIPSWLRVVGSRDEIAEWTAILKSRRGQDQAERRLEFQRTMRQKHPDMPLTFDEELEQGAKRLEANPWLRWREGLGFLDADPVVEKVVAQLSPEERHHLSQAIQAFEKANAAPDAVLTSSLADLPAEQRAVIEKVRHLSVKDP